MLRSLAAASALVLLAACSSSGGPPPVPSATLASATPPAPSPAALTASPTVAPSTDPMERARIAFLTLSHRDEGHLIDSAMALNAANDLASLRAALSKLALAESAFNADLSATHWPPTVSAKADAVMAAAAKAARLAAAAKSGDAATIAADLPGIQQAITDVSTTIADLESALGISTP